MDLLFALASVCGLTKHRGDVRLRNKQRTGSLAVFKLEFEGYCKEAGVHQLEASPLIF